MKMVELMGSRPVVNRVGQLIFGFCIAGWLLYGCAAVNTTYHYDPYTVVLPISAADKANAATMGITPNTIKLVKEYELQLKSASNANIAKILQMQDDGQMGYIGSISVMPGDDEILVMHRGHGRCCNNWCPIPYDHPGLGSCSHAPIPEPIVYWLKNGVVLRAYCPGFFYDPHSINKDPDGIHIWVTDHVHDQGFWLNLETGQIDAVVGEYWNKARIDIGQPPAESGEKRAIFSRFAFDPANLGLLCMPTTVARSLEFNLLFVASGYCDTRVVVFNATDMTPLWAIKHDQNQTGWFFATPHSILIFEEKQQILVANREMGTVDVFSFGGLFIASYDLRTYGPGRVFRLHKLSETKILILLSGVLPLSGVILEADANMYGVVSKAYAVPVGHYPMHDMDFKLNEQGTLEIYISSPWPEYYTLPKSARLAEGSTSEQVVGLLQVQWIGVLVGAAVIPFFYFLHKFWDNIVGAISTFFAWLFCQLKREAKKKEKKKEGGTGATKNVSYTKLDAADVEMASAGKGKAAAAAGQAEWTPFNPADSSAAGPSGATPPPIKTAKEEGCVYFIRHGESTSNERGIFAGIYDVRLTKFGELQAKQAGKDIKAKRLLFDRVYCSHLRRTAYTAKNALEESGNGHLVPLMQHDSRIAERSFGIFAGQNIRLLQQSLGYHQYEELLHSPHQAPPMGEKIADVYARVKDFYETEIIPKVEAGEKVLVVSHQYALEPLALYLCGLGPEDYNNMNLPNGKAMSVDDLRKYRNAESSPWKKALQEVGDMATILTFKVSPLLLVVCILIRMWIGHAIWPAALSKVLLIISLVVSTFYSFLEVDLGTSVQKCPAKASLMVLVQVLLHIIFGSIVLAKMHNVNVPLWDVDDEHRRAYMTLTALLWLTPPAITVPSLSLLWGGGLYLAVTVSLLLSALMPVLLIIYVATNMVPGASMNSLSFFYSIFFIALVLPAAAAHLVRQWKPVEVKKHSKDWKWLATPAYWIMLLVAVELYTPDSLSQALNMNYDSFLERPVTVVPLSQVKRIQRNITLVAIQSSVLMLINFVIMRVSALLSAWVLSYWEDNTLGGKKKRPPTDKGPNNTEEQISDNEKALRAMNCMDCYILLTTPNFFLFASMTAGAMNVNGLPVGQYMVFWAMLLWFLIPGFEQSIIANRFMSRLLQRSLGSLVQEEFIQGLWNIFKDPKLQTQATALVHQIHAITTQDTLGLGSPTMRAVHQYTAEQFKQTLELAAQGSVQFDDFLKYFQRTGVAINLNLPDRPLKGTGDGGNDGSAAAPSKATADVQDLLTVKEGEIEEAGVQKDLML